MGGKIGLIIFVIILLGVGLYLVTSGAITKGVQGLNSLINTSTTLSLFHLGSSSSTFGSSFATIGPAGPQGTTISNPSSPANTGSAGTTVNPVNIPKGFTAAELSPYYGQVNIESVTSGNSYSYGTIILNAYLTNPSSTIDITGWKIQTDASGEYIPQAINVYDPTGLTPPSDIRMKSGDTVYLYSSSAPFNLRLNECIGYVAHVANFVPALPLSCPSVNQSQIQGLTGECQNYIESISSCSAPNTDPPQISRTDYSCQDYLENNFTYKSCFEQHDTDANFLSNQVWVWTGGNVVDEYHDTVLLLDKNGLLVSEYTY